VRTYTGLAARTQLCALQYDTVIEITTLSSSSGGNCALITHSGRSILIDAGISLKRTGVYLSALGVNIRDVDTILITHTHSDHVGNLRMLTKHLKISVVSSAAAADSVSKYLYPGTRHVPIAPGDEITAGGMSVIPFRTPHDCTGSVGYSITADDRRLVFVTDLGIVTDEVMAAAIGADLAVIESNHDIKMLKTGPYPSYLKNRILSSQGHLSNDLAGEFAVDLARKGTRHILLAHISLENNTPELAVRTCIGRLASAGASPHDCSVDFAPQFDMGITYKV